MITWTNSTGLQGPDNGSETRQDNASEEEAQQPGLECHYCQGLGHEEPDCPNKQQADARQASAAAVPQLPSSSESSGPASSTADKSTDLPGQTETPSAMAEEQAPAGMLLMVLLCTFEGLHWTCCTGLHMNSLLYSSLYIAALPQCI